MNHMLLYFGCAAAYNNQDYHLSTPLFDAPRRIGLEILVIPGLNLPEPGYNHGICLCLFLFESGRKHYGNTIGGPGKSRGTL